MRQRGTGHGGAGRAGVGRVAHRRGFTLFELLVAIGIIFLLMGLLIAAVRAGRKSGAESVDRATVTGLKNAVSQFNQTFKFIPPLVRDNETSRPGTPGTGGPLNKPADQAGSRPVVFTISDPAQLRFMCGYDSSGVKIAWGQADYRFSEYSLPYYVMGLLPLKVDGLDGPGMRGVKRDGSFESAGATYQPFFDVSKVAKSVYTEDEKEGRIELRDKYGNSYRYYRWVHGRFDTNGKYSERVTTADEMNIPWIFWNSNDPTDVPGEAKDATYAIVSAGPNGLFGDEALTEIASKLGVSDAQGEAKLRALARKDNTVEFGR